jgi:adenylylsulfate kinase-like enzyme
LVAWFTGLPGSGKTTLVNNVLAELANFQNSRSILVVSMDEIRKDIYPSPSYSESERDAAYRAFVLIGYFLSSAGKNVILDGSGHKLVWRNFARQKCPRFFEVYVRCPIEVCIERETKRVDQNLVRKRLYEDALKRLEAHAKITGVGVMPGVDEPFEESPNPELVINCSETKDLQTIKRVSNEIGRRILESG